MNGLFSLAHEIVVELKRFSEAQKDNGTIFTFRSCTITNTKLVLEFITNRKGILEMELSVHPADAPWSMQIKHENDVLFNFGVGPNQLNGSSQIHSETACRISEKLKTSL